MLNLDWATIAFQIANFLVLAVVLYYVLFRPMMRRVKERAAEKRRQTQELAEERREVERLRAEWEERLANAQEEADRIISQAQEQVEAERQEMLEDVEQEAERILTEAHQDAQHMRQQAWEEFHDELLEAILSISAQVISQTAPPELHDRLLKQLNERIWEMGRSEIERVEAFRRSLGERTPTAYVNTARPLSPEQQGELARTLTALADRSVDLEIETDLALGAGIQVRLVDIIVENSIAGRLEEIRETVSRKLEEYEASE